MDILTWIRQPKNALKVAVALIVLFIAVQSSPVHYNRIGYRQVIETPLGGKYVVFDNGLYFTSPFSTTTEYPNVITIAYVGMDDKLEGTITTEEGQIDVQFRDGSKANVSAISRIRLPDTEAEMLKIHSENRSIKKFASTTIAPYVKEALRATAQLFESETVYTGGRTQFSQDWQDQLTNGQFLIDIIIEEKIDSLTRETEKIYRNKKRLDANGVPLRTESDIEQFGVTVANANLLRIDFDEIIDNKIKLKVDAATRESVAKQELSTARQEALTAEEKGKQKLVEIEYQKKQEQTSKLVAAETRVREAELDLKEQEIKAKAALKEAQVTKTLADAEAYKKAKVFSADGALEKKLEAWVKVNEMYAKEFGKQKWVSEINMGGNNQQSGATDLSNLLMVQTAKELGLNLNMKK